MSGDSDLPSMSVGRAWMRNDAAITQLALKEPLDPHHEGIHGDGLQENLRPA